MAQIIPFKGICYNPAKIDNMSSVVTPPYDVITPEMQDEFYEKHPNNIVRLILGKIDPQDNETSNRYTRAAEVFNAWQKDKILVQDDKPAIYITATKFNVDGQTYTRYGLILLVKLEPFEKGIILPHEKTFSQVKEDRLKLMKTCATNFSPIFTLFSDKGLTIIEQLKAKADADAPEVSVEDIYGYQHSMWKNFDPDFHHFLQEQMLPKKLFIADGHHRYETALAYKEWARENQPTSTDSHPADYIMMYVSIMEDPGLVIRAAHRLLLQVNQEKRSQLIANLKPYFEITPFPIDTNNPKKAIDELSMKLQAGTDRHSIGVVIFESTELYALELKPDVMKTRFASLAESLRKLDVTVLTNLIMMDVLGMDQDQLNDESLIAYSSKFEEAAQNTLDGKCDVCFLLNATPIEQVRDIAENGLIMPRKSTYFYPKVITGMVQNLLK